MSDWWSSPRQPPGAIPFRSKFDAARDPLTARNAIGAVDAKFVTDAIAASGGGGGGGGGAPLGAQYVTAATDATLTAERVLTNTPTVTWDFSIAGQAKANAVTSGGGAPTTAEYITASADATLTNERVLTNTATVTWDFSTPGQAKAAAVTSGGGHFTAGITAPASPTAGDFWYDLSTGVLSIFVNDGNSSAWIQVSPPGGGAGTPIGAISMFGGATPPTGWYLCNGQAVSRTLAALFAVCGTTYGAGDGSTTFNLPNLKKKFPLGYDPAGTAMGAGGGSEFLQQHNHGINDPWHGHSINDPGHYHNYNSAFDQAVGGDGSQSASVKSYTNTDQQPTGISINSGPTGITIQNAGTGNAQNMPPYQVVNYIIYAGV